MLANCPPVSIGNTFQWKIQNINHCWLQKGERLDSPPFIADTLEGTKWTLRLYPMGHGDKDGVGFFLHRDVDCTGPDYIDVSFELSFLGKDGSFLKSKNASAFNFTRNRSWGLEVCETKGNVIFTEKETFPPEDSIMVKCTIWDTEEKPVDFKMLYARTVFKEEQRFFKWEIDKFNYFKLGMTKQFRDDFINFDLSLEKNRDFGKMLIINMNSLSESIKYFAVKSSYEDFKGNKELCGFSEYFNDNLRIGKLCALNFNNWLQRNRNQYCFIKSFFFDCEYVVAMKTAFYESFAFGLYSPEFLNGAVGTRKENYDENKKSATTETLNDFKYMFGGSILSGTHLQTSTKTYPAHKVILSTRSSVFRWLPELIERSCRYKKRELRRKQEICNHRDTE